MPDEETLIGYGPVTDGYPYIPDFLVLQTNGVRKIDRQGTSQNLTARELDSQIVSKQITLFKIPKLYRAGHWCAVEHNGIYWFLKSNERPWAIGRATQILQSLDKDPIQAMQSLRIAAKLCSIPLDELVKFLESKRNNSKENLADVFQRIKNHPIK